jgi:GTPase SAR1 family protein
MDAMPPFIVVGTKSDLLDEPHVRSLGLVDEANSMAKRLGAHGGRCFQCSALAGEGVENLFKDAVRAVQNSAGGGGAGCCVVQ